MEKLILAIDQGTTSTRTILFDRSASPVAVAQKEHRQIFPKPGWVEHDPLEIWQNTSELISEVMQSAKINPSQVGAIGITNQRETAVLWDKTTGKPVHNALVWQDTRTDQICAELAKNHGQDRFRQKTGLPLATYFSGPKLKWLLDSAPELRARAKNGELLFGTIDSWLIWNLTGGPDGGVHATDVTNARRTMLMDLATLQWDKSILSELNIPEDVLPLIRTSSEVYGTARGILEGVPIAGMLGDQQAALFGQNCFDPGDVKNTYGTGCFMLLTTGRELVHSQHGLITTVAFQLGKDDPNYALEGSIAVTGSLVQWLRDNLGIINKASEVEKLASKVEDSGGIFFFPAFSGLFAPYWRSDARGAIVGMTRYTNKYHIARAALEATAYQTREVLDSMLIDSNVKIKSLRVDGGMTSNDLLMQFQADILGIPVVRPIVTETTSRGAAYAAGLATGFWRGIGEIRGMWKADREWTPQMDKQIRTKLYQGWKRAVTKTFNWVDVQPKP
ncbi:MAG TPA: glycerol kinase GlpK [Bellilinea sp.]|nr:glycerol kinase GlpK [Bellilinea sp.]